MIIMNNNPRSRKTMIHILKKENYYACYFPALKQINIKALNRIKYYMLS